MNAIMQHSDLKTIPKDDGKHFWLHASASVLVLRVSMEWIKFTVPTYGALDCCDLIKSMNGMRWQASLVFYSFTWCLTFILSLLHLNGVAVACVNAFKCRWKCTTRSHAEVQRRRKNELLRRPKNVQQCDENTNHGPAPQSAENLFAFSCVRCVNHYGTRRQCENINKKQQQ